MLFNGGLKRLISRWTQNRQNSCCGRAASVISVVIVPNRHLFKWDNKKSEKRTNFPTFQTPNFLDFKWDKKHFKGIVTHPTRALVRLIVGES